MKLSWDTRYRKTIISIMVTAFVVDILFICAPLFGLDAPWMWGAQVALGVFLFVCWAVWLYVDSELFGTRTRLLFIIVVAIVVFAFAVNLLCP